jgi:hypothetical protein
MSLPNRFGHCQRTLTFTQIFQTSLKCNQFSVTTVKYKALPLEHPALSSKANTVLSPAVGTSVFPPKNNKNGGHYEIFAGSFIAVKSEIHRSYTSFMSYRNTDAHDNKPSSSIMSGKVVSIVSEWVGGKGRGICKKKKNEQKGLNVVGECSCPLFIYLFITLYFSLSV